MMGGSALLLLSLVIHVLADSPELVVEKKVAGVLGKPVVLRCLYVGDSGVVISAWSQKRENGKWKPLSGYITNKLSQMDANFGIPVSPSNLTVIKNITSLEDEGEYKCSFQIGLEAMDTRIHLTVLVQPTVQTQVEELVKNGTHFQRVTCSAGASKPAAVVTWLVDGRQPSNETFSVNTTTIQHSNHTTTQTSVLHFPTHLLEGEDVACVVHHDTSAVPIREIVKVVTFVAPVVSMETHLVQADGIYYHEVTCRASRGRPAADLTWTSSEGVEAKQSPDGQKQERDAIMDTITVTSWQRFAAHLHEGQNVTCIVDHPKLVLGHQRVVTLPTYHISSMQVVGSRVLSTGQVLLEEGQSNVTLELQVESNVPHYQINCTKEKSALQTDIAITDSSLMIEGPVQFQHAGWYECKAFYYNHQASMQLEIQVAPQVLRPVLFAPNTSIQSWEEEDVRVILCSAANSIPLANLTWVLPEDLPRAVISNSTLGTAAYSEAIRLELPVCFSWAYQVICKVEHPALAQPEIQQMSFPKCLEPNISLESRIWFEEDMQYILVECRADAGSKPEPTISWQMEGVQSQPNELHRTNWTHPNGSVTVGSMLRLPVASVAGRTVVCTVNHPSLQEPVKRHLSLPFTDVPKLRVFLRWQPASPQFSAVCESTRGPFLVNLTWILPENKISHMVLQSGKETSGYWVNSTYSFPLAIHEGQNLTCLMQNKQFTAEKTIQVPQFYISSVEAVNATAAPTAHGGVDSAWQRVVLQRDAKDQRVMFKVFGRVPAFNFSCVRRDGIPVPTIGASLVFPSKVSTHDAGLYTCHASFHHHRATVKLQVNVSDKDEEFLNFVLISFSAGIAIALILIVSICVFCKGHSKEVQESKKRESLADLTSLMQDYCSPQLKKAAAQGSPSCKGDPQYPELLSYSIVIDIKTTV